jgi:DNA/RNA-binding domain of Phe-tRNA-synthetase-like protein
MTGHVGPIGPRRGAIDPAIAAELPGLRLDWLTITVASRAAPSGADRTTRLRMLADRYRGATVIAMRTHPIARAYRTFYRQIGLDPDVDRIPSEQAATARLLQGGFRSADLISDACLMAVIETGVPVWALDAAAVDPAPPGLGIGLAGAGVAAPDGAALEGALVIRDHRAVHAPLFGTPLPGAEPAPSTTAVTLYSLGVEGVPQIHIDEALWLAADLLSAGGGR